MSIINEALKKTQTNLDNIKEKAPPVTEDRVSSGQKAWQQPASQPSRTFTPAVPSSAPVVSPDPQAQRASPRGKSAGKRWYLIVLAEILVLGLAAWTLFIFQPQLFRSSHQAKKTSPAGNGITRIQQPNPVALSPQSPPLMPTMSPATRSPARPLGKSNLVLNGIMIKQNKMIALINGGIYETGDFVAGKEIKKITLDRVELTDGEEVTTLSVRNQGQ